ncbi:hypothetical protein QJS10_CPB12g00682 [Acorus calamus]|uniref:Uncharacterized protein n=1 Tax=Acorus calamus TaxID=4465 RepID=A0AAV9DN76_ACOCL|nr:hypothetical protein QJS10_CPB12g00682 [Acorus calamus]
MPTRETTTATGVDGDNDERWRRTSNGRLEKKKEKKSFVTVREVGSMSLGRASSMMMDPRIVSGKGSVADAGDVWGDHRVVSPL